jgi:hypothetical protein
MQDMKNILSLDLAYLLLHAILIVEIVSFWFAIKVVGI